MPDNASTLADYARRMRSLVEEDVRIAADLRELAKEMRDLGHRPVVLKAWIKALVLAEDYDKPSALENLKTKTQDAAMYAGALGIDIDGFGGTKHIGVNVSVATPHDPETGEVLDEAPATEVPSAPSPGSTGGRPCTPSPDAVPAADETAPHSAPSDSGQSEQAADPIPDPDTDIPAFLRRDPSTNRAPWMDREAAE